MSDTDEIQKMHEQMLYPSVRVRTGKAGGSGTVVFSGKNANGEYETYVTTNHHVVEDAIEVKRAWNSRVGKEIKKEYCKTVQVELFRYNDLSRCIGTGIGLEADIMMYDVEQDFALLKVREKEMKIDFVANIFPIAKLPEIHIYDELFAVGAALGHPPISTDGRLTYMDDEIDNFKYWMSTAATIFGNSGGSVYRQNDDGDYEYIGIPSRISISGFADAITHMGYFIPIDRIYKLLKENDYQFIYDSNYTIEQCNKARDVRKKSELKKLELQQGPDDDEFGDAPDVPSCDDDCPSDKEPEFPEE